MEVGTKMTMIANLTDPSTKRNMIAKPRPPAAPSPTSTASRRRLKYYKTKHDQDDNDNDEAVLEKDPGRSKVLTISNKALIQK